MGIVTTQPGRHAVHLDQAHNIDLLVCAAATPSSNAYAAASAQVLLEAIVLTGYSWQQNGATMPDAMLAIFKLTGVAVRDETTGLTFKELDLLSALDEVCGGVRGE